jgi:hypothetical protein
MTVVQMNVKVPSVDGLVPARGAMLWQPTARRVVAGDAVVLPAPFTVSLVDGVGTAVVEPSTMAWVWFVTESFYGAPTKKRAFAVPDTVAVNYADLVEVDPATLDPVAEPEAAWWAALQSAELGVNAVVDPDDPDALILHFPSWQADPADELILIMPIQEA